MSDRSPEYRPSEYRAASTHILLNTPGVRSSVGSATRDFDARRAKAYEEVESGLWRDWARSVKANVLSRLDEYLLQAEESLRANGTQVHWASSADDVYQVLRGIVEKNGVKTVVKSKSMLSEELEVNNYLETLGVRSIETDLGEYIIQLLDEPPSHIVGPAIHKSLEDCRALFHEQLGTPIDADPDELASAARSALREDFLSADLGISGGNFLAADTGTVALIENEGNIRLTTSVPRIHVALVGIEKVLPRLVDLAGFLQLTSRAATGQPIGLFVSLIQGPRKSEEPDGPEEVHVVFVDNGRSALYEDDVASEALGCVRCGACLNICPVYRQTGGHAYGWTYPGPIGAIISPGLLGLDKAMPLPHASSLCGACEDVCPVRIPIPELLVHWREKAVSEGQISKGERFGIRMYADLAERPLGYSMAASALRRAPWRAAGAALPVLNGWLQEREIPEPSSKSFRQLWREGIE